MEKDANYFTVGLFASLAFLGLIGFLIWLIGAPHGGGDRYTVYYTDAVSGLNEDSTVKFKGVEVGKVIALRLAPERSDLVKVDIEVKKDTPVHARTAATVEMTGITGQGYIELENSPGDDKPPERHPDEEYPVLNGKGSQLAKFLDDLPKISSQFTTTLTSVNDLSHDAGKMTESIRALADKLKEDPSQLLRGPSHKGVDIPK